MVATKNVVMLRWLLDIAGVDVNMKQSDNDAGGFNALWDRALTIETMQVLLSRGIDPNQKCYSRKIETCQGEEPREEHVLLHLKDWGKKKRYPRS